MPRPRQASFSDVGEKVMAELFRRLSTQQGAASLPGTHLMAMAQKYITFLERQEEQSRQQFEAAAKEASGLEKIDRPGLSIEKRKEFLLEYIDRLETEWRAASERLVELMEGKDGGEKMSDLQDVVPEEGGDVPELPGATGESKQVVEDSDAEQPSV